jgi:diadenosine tetraphosphatase ApaH/serine/threonine PP2A family protein phosphatase
MNWESLDWEVLDRLRGDFLSGATAAGPYWHTITDLECYDFTYGERIGWKWDAVLAELKLRGWSPPAGGVLLDWGCGSGSAGRRVADHFGPAHFSRLLLHDHSALALDYAEHRGRRAFPALPVDRADRRFLETGGAIGVLVVSHVLNELNEIARAELTALAGRAEAVLWVEPGTHEISRALGGWREKLRAEMQVLAPCTHSAACGVLAAGNERHWCHFFATPPAGVHTDSGWVKFGRRAGIDLRSLPYSFLALARRDDAPDAAGGQEPPLAGFSRIIGEPRLYKGFAKIFNCDAAGVGELTLQKRADPALFKEFKRGDGPLLYRWTRTGAQITAVEKPPAAGPGFGTK